MSVIVNGQRFLEEADVQGNPALAQEEANIQLAFAKSEFTRREPETRVDENNNPDPNGKFVNAGRVSDLRANIASQLPAIVVGTQRQSNTSGGPLQVTIGGSQFVISETWPVTASSEQPSSTPGSPAPAAPIQQPPQDPNIVQPGPPTTTPGSGEPINSNPEIVGGGGGAPGDPDAPGEVDIAGPGSGSAGTSNTNEGAPGDPDAAGEVDIEGATNTEISEDIPGIPGVDAGDNVEISGAKSATGPKGPTNPGLQADLKLKIEPRENELDQFNSYTYNAALYMLEPKNYVRLLKNPTSVASAPKSLLMRNGGTGGDRELADEFRNTEFFIDDLTFDNIGSMPSTRTVNTNAINIKFNIIEPNGCTLIERLKKQSEQSLETDQSYLQTPYLLEIKFKGYDELGKISNGVVKPKYVPIKLQKLSFSVDAMGTHYRVVAVPYHHDVFGTLRSTIPVNIQVSAGTVGDVLGGLTTIFTQEPVREQAFTLFEGQTEDQLVDETTIVTGSKDVLGETAASLPDAVNNFYKQQTKDTRVRNPKTKKMEIQKASSEVAEKWVFKIADDINNSKLVGSSIDALNTAQKTKNVYQQYGSVMKGKVNLDKNKKLFKINAGTSVIALINYIIVASDYFKDNILSLNEAASNKTESENPIKWFKVIPQITGFVGWDKKQGKYKFEITWAVQTSGVFYSDYPWAPKTKPKGEGVHKIYDYIFTGENKHVLNCRLDFNMAYYLAAQFGSGVPQKVGDKTPNTMSPQIKDVPQSTQGQNISDDETPKDKRAKDLMGSILHDGSDLISVNLDIVGDPAFLPTGDGFYQPQGNRDTVYSTAFLPDGTINYDITPPYIQLNFKTPVDYDDVTGFADPNINKKYGTAEFSGVYTVYKVSNSMSGGVFTQNIYAVRNKMQPIKGRIDRSRESQINNDRVEFVQDLQKAQGLLNLLVNNNIPASNIAAKITRAADSSITNITTNVLPKLGQELDQVATNAVPELQRAGNQMRNFLGSNFPERIAQEIDFQVGFNNEDIDL